MNAGDGDPRRNAEGYLDLTAFEALKREQRKSFGYRPLVYICSPYSGDVQANVAVAREFYRVAVERRKIPFAPHLLFPQFMNDQNPCERELAMFFNRILIGHCESVWVYADHISAGMRQEISWARSMGLPVKYFTINFEGGTPVSDHMTIFCATVQGQQNNSLNRTGFNRDKKIGKGTLLSCRSNTLTN